MDDSVGSLDAINDGGGGGADFEEMRKRKSSNQVSRAKMQRKLMKHLLDKQYQLRRPEIEEAQDFLRYEVLPRKALDRDNEKKEGRLRHGVGPLFPVFSTSCRELFDVDDGVGLYFTGLLRTIKVLLLIGLVNLPNMLTFASAAYNTAYAPVSLPGTFAIGRGTNASDVKDAGKAALAAVDALRDIPWGSAACEMVNVTNSLTNGTLLARTCPLETSRAYIDLLAFVVGCMAFVFSFRVEDALIRQTELAATTAENYSVIVQNPQRQNPPRPKSKHPAPDDAYPDPDQWADYFRQYGDVAYVTLHLDNMPFMQALLRLHMLLHKCEVMRLAEKAPSWVSCLPGCIAWPLHKLRIGRDFKYWQGQLAKTKAQVERGKRDRYKLLKVFVTFNKEQQKNTCLEKLSHGFLYTLLHSVGVALCCCSSWESRLHVEPACNPKQVVWQNLGVSHFKRQTRRALTIGIVFGYIYQTVKAIPPIRDQAGTLAVGVFISLSNWLLQFVIFVLSRKVEIHADFNEWERALCRHLTIARIANSALITYVLVYNNNPSDMLSPSTLAQVQNVLLTDTFVAPVLRLLDLQTRFQQHVLAPRKSTQERMDLLYTGSAWHLAERYSDLTKSIFIALFYMGILPTGVFFAALSLAINYWTDKYMLLRRWKAVPPSDKTLAEFSRNGIMAGLFMHLVMSAIFFAGWPWDSACRTADGRFFQCDKGTGEFSRTAPPNLVSLDVFRLYIPAIEKAWMAPEQQAVVMLFHEAMVAFVAVMFVFGGGDALLALLRWLFTSWHHDESTCSGVELVEVTPRPAAYVPMVKRKDMLFPRLCVNTSLFSNSFIHWEGSTCEALTPSDYQTLSLFNMMYGADGELLDGMLENPMPHHHGVHASGSGGGAHNPLHTAAAGMSADTAELLRGREASIAAAKAAIAHQPQNMQVDMAARSRVESHAVGAVQPSAAAEHESHLVFSQVKLYVDEAEEAGEDKDGVEGSALHSYSTRKNTKLHQLFNQNRRCTDVVFAVMYLVLLLTMGIIALYGSRYGDSNRLLYPTNHEGDTCGVNQHKGKYNVYYPQLQEDLVNAMVQEPEKYNPLKGGSIMAVPLFGVCVKHCPAVGETYCDDAGEGEGEQQGEQQCWTSAYQFSSLLFRCVPLDSVNQTMSVRCLTPYRSDPIACKNRRHCKIEMNTQSLRVEGSAPPETFSGSLCTGIEISAYSQVQTGAQSSPVYDQLSAGILTLQTWAGDVALSAGMILICGIPIALLMSFFWLLLLEYYTSAIVWANIISVFSILILITLHLYELAGAHDFGLIAEDSALLAARDKFNAVTVAATTTLSKNADDEYTEAAAVNYILYAAYAFTAVDALLMMVLIFYRKVINLGTGIIEIASEAVIDMPALFVVPVLGAGAAGGFALFWFLAAANVASMATVASQEMYGNATGGLDLLTAATANASFFGHSVGLSNSTTSTVQALTSVPSLLCLMSFGLVWTMSLISALVDLTVAGAISRWYWTEPAERHMLFVRDNVVQQGIYNTFRYHVGSAAFGSLVLAVIVTLRAALVYLDKETKELQKQSRVLKLLFMCLQCMLACLQRFVEYISRMAYIVIAIKGQGFFASSKVAFHAMRNHTAQIFIVQAVSRVLIFLTKCSTAMVSTILCSYILQNPGSVPLGFVENQGASLSSPLLPLIFSGVFGYMTASFCFSVYELAIDSVLMSYCLDFDENKDTGEFYMSYQLKRYIEESAYNHVQAGKAHDPSNHDELFDAKNRNKNHAIVHRAQSKAKINPLGSAKDLATDTGRV